MVAPASPTTSRIDAFVVAAQPSVRDDAALLCAQLRGAGLRVENDLRGNSLKSQLRRADKMQAPVALILGEDEVAKGKVQLKDLRAQVQQEVDRGDIAATVRALLG